MNDFMEILICLIVGGAISGLAYAIQAFLGWLWHQTFI